MEQYDEICFEVSRNSIVCVNSCEAGTFQGEFFHPSLKNGEPFRSLAELFRKLDRIMDESNRSQQHEELCGSIKIPEASIASPYTACKGMYDYMMKNTKGKMGTFYLRILYRRNASWQGQIIWAESGEKNSFRSTLELMYLLDSVLDVNSIE